MSAAPARRRSLALLLGGGILALVAACVAAAWMPGSPLVPRNGGHPGGGPGWAWAFLGCLVAAFALYVAAVALIDRAGAPRRGVVVLAVAIQLAPLAAPLLLSTDAWTYWSYARVAAVHGSNPYVHPPSAFPADAALPWVGTAWRTTTSVYGPAFTAASEPVALVSGRSGSAAAWIFKVAAAAAVLGCAVLAARLSPRPALAWALVGWNPVLAVHFAGGAHNDALMMVLVLGALALAAAGRLRLAGAAWAGAILVKWVAVAFLVLRAVEARSTRRRVDHVGFAVAAAALLAVAFGLYGTHWLAAFRPLARSAERETSFAFPHRLQQAGLPHGVAIGLAVAALVLGAAWLVREAARGRARLGLAACLLLLVSPYLVVWYAVWAIPLAAAEDDRPAQAASLALCAYLLAQRIPV